MSEPERKPLEPRPDRGEETARNTEETRPLREGQYVMQRPIPEPAKPKKRRPSSQPKPKD